MNKKFDKVSNIAQIAFWGIITIFTILSLIVLLALKFEWIKIIEIIAQNGEFVNDFILMPFLGGFTDTGDAFLVIVLNILLILAIVWLIFVAILGLLGKTNHLWVKLTTIGACAFAVIVLFINILKVVAFYKSIPTAVPFTPVFIAIILMLALAYVITIQVIKLIKKE